MIDYRALDKFLHARRQSSENRNTYSLDARQDAAEHKPRIHRQIVQIDLPIYQMSELCKYIHIPNTLLVSEALSSFTLDFPQADFRCIKPKDYKGLLGQEFSDVIYDARKDIDLNSLYAVSGMLKKQGLLVIYTDTSANTDEIPASLKHSYGQPVKDSLFKTLFLGRLADLGHGLITTKRTRLNVKYTNSHQVNETESVVSRSAIFSPSTEQQEIADKIYLDLTNAFIQLKSSHHLILGARGRGKSSLMGYIAHKVACWKSDNSTCSEKANWQVDIVVCADSKSQCSTLFDSYTLLCKQMRHHHKFDSQITFKAIDQVISQPSSNTLLIIDEIASLAPDLVKQVMLKYPYVIFAGTTAGYEGSGQGFTKRLLPFIESRYTLSQFTLSQPLRWYENDPVEHFFDTFLNPIIPYPTSLEQNHLHKHFVISESITPRILDKKEFLKNSRLLTDVIGLLVEAHYQTTPNDIVRALDAENCLIILLESQANLIGVATVFVEGGEILQSLASQISLGKRRVQGHLSPQALSSYIADKTLTTPIYWRINRIAIASNYHRNGYGSMLLSACYKYALQRGAGFISTSFGYTNDLFSFWKCNDFTLSKVGQRIDTSSTSASIIMLKPISDSYDKQIACLTTKSLLDLIYYLRFDERLRKIYQSLHEHVCLAELDSSVSSKLLRSMCILYKSEQISFASLASLVFMEITRCEDDKQRILTDKMAKWYAGNMHKHQRIEIELEMLAELYLTNTKV